MKLPDPKNSGINTTGLTGIALMVLHLTGTITGWYWIVLYVILILSGIGQEYKNKTIY
jgi:hypothetical protein